MNCIVLVPDGKDLNNRPTFDGTQFESLDAARNYLRLCLSRGQAKLMRESILLVNGTAYEFSDHGIAQAHVDFK